MTLKFHQSARAVRLSERKFQVVANFLRVHPLFRPLVENCKLVQKNRYSEKSTGKGHVFVSGLRAHRKRSLEGKITDVVPDFWMYGSSTEISGTMCLSVHINEKFVVSIKAKLIFILYVFMHSLESYFKFSYSVLTV